MLPRAHDEGLKEELSHLAKDAGKYLQARGELLAIETKEATDLFQRRGKALAIACLFAGIAYLLLLAGVAGWLAIFLNQQGDGILFGWIGSVLALGTAHGFIALIFLFKGRKASSKEPLFEYSRREWAKDQTWIKEDIAKKS